MWWIIVIWIICGLAACRLAAIDWIISFNDGVEWGHLWGIFIVCFFLPFCAPLYFLHENSSHQKEIYKRFYTEVRDWVKHRIDWVTDHIDWGW